MTSRYYIICDILHIKIRQGVYLNMTTIFNSKVRSFFIICALLISSIFLSPAFSSAQTTSVAGTSHPNKAIILTFGDTIKSQFTNAKPILDKYGFKGNFLITCLWVGDKSRLTWQDVLALQKDGQDIGSKTMTHRRMTHLSPSELSYEIAGSKKCLANHGINATAFATTHGNERNNATIINEISKYYDLAINGFGTLMFLHCNGYIKYSSQTDCRTYFSNGYFDFCKSIFS